MTTLHYSVSTLTPYINWTYFFHAWQIAPRFATIAHVHDCMSCRKAWIESFSAEDKEQAKVAAELFTEASTTLQQMEKDGVKAKTRFDILPCRADGDDLVFENQWRLPCLRQQKTEGTCLCLADFVLPVGLGGGNGVNDHVGLFATTAGFANKTDMLRQTLFDRLAEAAAERMHEEVRRHFWGYAPNERLSIPELHREAFQGIRPAVGYPCLPDQRIIFPIHRRLKLSEIGITLTENGAMLPHASTCGLMLAHPEAHYFAVGQVSEEQRADYKRRYIAYCL